MNRSPVGVYGEASWAVQLGGGGGAAVTDVTGRAIARDGDDFASRGDYLANHVVIRVGDEQVAYGVEGQVARAVQFGESVAGPPSPR